MDLLNKFQTSIGYIFKDEELLRQALTHSSFSHEMKINIEKHNERIEFLGDAVLELVVSDNLYKNHTEVSEGELSKLRASLVCEPSLATCAREIDLGAFLKLGKGELATGGKDKDSILSDAFEALIGAIYLDSGIEEASKFIYAHLLNDIEKHIGFYDSKSRLQEFVQKNYKEQLTYEIINESGPDHNKSYEAIVLLGNKKLACGTGKTKKSAQQQAAYQALKILNK